MTETQIRNIMEGWCHFQLSPGPTAVGPRELSAPIHSQSLPPGTWFPHYQFVQVQIERHCAKSYDRDLLAAVLIAHFWHRQWAQSVVVPCQIQEKALHTFLERFKTLKFSESREQIAVA